MATRSVTDPIEQEHAAVVHVEMGFDAFGLGVSVLLEAAADSGQLDRGQVQRAEHAAEHEDEDQDRVYTQIHSNQERTEWRIKAESHSRASVEASNFNQTP